MSYTLSVVYPGDVTFNLDYYLTTHMPLVQKTWAPVGLKKYKVVEYTSPGTPYKIQAILTWESKEKADAALAGPGAAAILGDIPNFSDKDATFLSGESRTEVSC
ncbi:hypothetical protein F4861DRAFT_539649 [Xylaria intraflava]|nr:hypothetical protein F4861DRAFT_539649 [Xylaria intraflava]